MISTAPGTRQSTSTRPGKTRWWAAAGPERRTAAPAMHGISFARYPQRRGLPPLAPACPLQGGSLDIETALDHYLIDGKVPPRCPSTASCQLLAAAAHARCSSTCSCLNIQAPAPCSATPSCSHCSRLSPCSPCPPPQQAQPWHRRLRPLLDPGQQGQLGAGRRRLLARISREVHWGGGLHRLVGDQATDRRGRPGGLVVLLWGASALVGPEGGRRGALAPPCIAGSPGQQQGGRDLPGGLLVLRRYPSRQTACFVCSHSASVNACPAPSPHDPPQVTIHEGAKAAYLVSGSMWVGFDLPQTIWMKILAARERGLGGLMVCLLCPPRPLPRHAAPMAGQMTERQCLTCRRAREVLGSEAALCATTR